MKVNYEDMIAPYLDGSLSAVQSNMFEEELQANAAFKAKFQIQKLAYEIIEFDISSELKKELVLKND